MPSRRNLYHIIHTKDTGAFESTSLHDLIIHIKEKDARERERLEAPPPSSSRIAFIMKVEDAWGGQGCFEFAQQSLS